MPDRFGLSREDYLIQADRRMVLDMQRRFPRFTGRSATKGNAMLKETVKRVLLILLIAAVALFVLAAVIGVARADGYVKTPHGEYRFGYDADFPSKIIVVPRLETDATRERDASWVRNCKITFDMDAFGVKHYNFSQSPSGCKFGYLPSEMQ